MCRDMDGEYFRPMATCRSPLESVYAIFRFGTGFFGELLERESIGGAGGLRAIAMAETADGCVVADEWAADERAPGEGTAERAREEADGCVAADNGPALSAGPSAGPSTSAARNGFERTVEIVRQLQGRHRATIAAGVRADEELRGSLARVLAEAETECEREHAEQLRGLAGKLVRDILELENDALYSAAVVQRRLQKLAYTYDERDLRTGKVATVRVVLQPEGPNRDELNRVVRECIEQRRYRRAHSVREHSELVEEAAREYVLPGLARLYAECGAAGDSAGDSAGSAIARERPSDGAPDGPPSGTVCGTARAQRRPPAESPGGGRLGKMAEQKEAQKEAAAKKTKWVDAMADEYLKRRREGILKKYLRLLVAAERKTADGLERGREFLYGTLAVENEEDVIGSIGLWPLFDVLLGDRIRDFRTAALAERLRHRKHCGQIRRAATPQISSRLATLLEEVDAGRRARAGPIVSDGHWRLLVEELRRKRSFDARAGTRSYKAAVCWVRAELQLGPSFVFAGGCFLPAAPPDITWDGDVSDEGEAAAVAAAVTNDLLGGE